MKKSSASMMITQIATYWCCLRCDYVWSAEDKKNPPMRCAKCRSPYWQSLKIRKALGKG